MAKPATFVSTLTEAANLSLAIIGEASKDLLVDIDTDTTKNSDWVRQFIYITIRDVQSEFRWDELITRVILTTPEDLTANDAYDWGYRYALPDDYLIPLWYDESDHEIESGYVYCNTEDDYRFHYVKYSIDPSEWSSHLLSVVKHRTAMAICVPITENETKYEALLTEYERIVLPRAERMSSYGKKVPNNRRKRSSWSRTRSNGGAY